ncbi:lipoprotein insertase outer membrane protein LolB [Candidimonas humi]|uniref:Lipoprotein insertase outer membrane protein LolB n=1 Tax=Candidimonas humi TaxID=683355 RepID=A0ABV8P411_9BURK|nr:lipoprotein insertase outer membrane protein LolB [Candidimonas humi]MBV6306179.1 lipoprotein insertase outer membrane protein LolB [Candidimonas humi]
MTGISSLLRYRAWLACGLLCLLAACATPQRIAGGTTQAFERVGRFALSATGYGGPQQAVQGGFAWNDDGRTLRLDLSNPLGSILARVQVRPGESLLTRADGTQERADDPDGLVEQVLGSAIPVAGLRDWLRGRTGSQPVQDLHKDEAGHIAAFVQNGWHVDLSNYDPQGPRLLRLTRDVAGRHISVRLVVDKG